MYTPLSYRPQGYQHNRIQDDWEKNIEYGHTIEVEPTRFRAHRLHALGTNVEQHLHGLDIIAEELFSVRDTLVPVVRWGYGDPASRTERVSGDEICCSSSEKTTTESKVVILGVTLWSVRVAESPAETIKERALMDCAKGELGGWEVNTGRIHSEEGCMKPHQQNQLSLAKMVSPLAHTSWLSRSPCLGTNDGEYKSIDRVE
ncbi:hypothetical protein DL93DRAFT_2102921 [Clavulina sp. PMI_390]|nr:hypothetical protein DL93DRAFT_2102921 [Clavulina sp. PMI_390]